MHDSLYEVNRRVGAGETTAAVGIEGREVERRSAADAEAFSLLTTPLRLPFRRLGQLLAVIHIGFEPRTVVSHRCEDRCALTARLADNCDLVGNAGNALDAD